MKKLLIICLLALGFTGYSQDLYFQESNEQAKEEASRITDQYHKQLALTGEQRLLFQQKVEEFLIREHLVKKEYDGTDELNMLLQLQEQETAEMQDILTRPQLDLYKNIKPDIQPLEVVEKK